MSAWSFAGTGGLPAPGRVQCQNLQRSKQLARPRTRGDPGATRAAAQGRDPPDTPKADRRGGREWLQTLLSRFGPITEKAVNTAVLDFEKPLVELRQSHQRGTLTDERQQRMTPGDLGDPDPTPGSAMRLIRDYRR